MKQGVWWLAATAGCAFLWGFVAGKYRVWPYRPMQATYWTAHAKVRPAPGGTDQFRVFAPQSDVVFVGDSITRAGNWSEIFRGVTVANRAIDGETVQELSLRLDTVLSVHPRKVFLMAGINDVYRLTDVPVILEAYGRVVTGLTQGGAHVYLQSTLECRGCGSSLARVRELNSGLRRIAAENEATWVDLNRCLSDRDGLNPALTSDGTHLNAAGYLQWSQVLAPYVAQKNTP